MHKGGFFLREKFGYLKNVSWLKVLLDVYNFLNCLPYYSNFSQIIQQRLGKIYFFKIDILLFD